MSTPLVLDWPYGHRSGAELAALHLTLHLHDGPVSVLPITPPSPGTIGLRNDRLALLRALLDTTPARRAALLQGTPATEPVDAILLRLLHRDLHGQPDPAGRAWRTTVGLVAATDAALSPDGRARARAHDLLLAPSAWVHEWLVEAGVRHVARWDAAFDGALFHPGPRAGHLADRFVVYAGGRLCDRKGQDLVLAAIKRFAARHPETLLLTTWQTPWPESAADIVAGGLVRTAPTVRSGALRIADWAEAEGLPARHIVDLGPQPQDALAVVLREADAAIVASRAEADANPHLLECLATGVPTIASTNTGHREIVDPTYCWPLTAQAPVRRDGRLLAGWGESSVDEIVAHLEAIHADRAAARARAARAADAVARHDWTVQAARLAELLAPVTSVARAA